MFSWENPDDRVAIVQMNAELRHAQLELLSAQCATHQLRLRFSIEDLARYAQRDVLRKAVDAASQLNGYYSSIEQHVPADPARPANTPVLTAEQIAQFTIRVSSYLKDEREKYLSMAGPISAPHRAILQPFFMPATLDRVRVVELNGARLSNPPFYAEARAMGFVNLPEVPHMASLTFQDVIVFNEKIIDRDLFHGLVHAVQFCILGLDRYTDAFVRGFVRTNSHITVPLEAHAFALEAKFAENRAESFSVEEQIRIWVREGRY